MGRKLEFDKSAALVKVMEDFWAQGYDSTSMRDLSERLGVHLGSVYNALGSKEELFKKAFEMSMEQHTLPMLRKLAESPDAFGALTDFINTAVNDCSKPDPAPGCFIINSVLEIASINGEITELLHGYMKKKEEFFLACVLHAQEQGKIRKNRDARTLARQILYTLYTFRMMAKLKLERKYFEDVRDGLLVSLTA